MSLVAGFLGLGKMGAPMAANIARAGIPLWLYNRTPPKAEALAQQVSAQIARTPAEVAAHSNVILTMVSDAAALEQLYFGADGIMDGLRVDTVCVEMSTSGPAVIRELAQAVVSAGARLLDAPVSGSVAFAASAQLTAMIGGDAGDLDRVRPILDAVAARVFHIGPLGAGATMKLVVNSIVYGLNQALAEGLVMAERAGIDRETAYTVFEHSVVAAPVVHYRRDAFLRPRSTPVSYPLRLAEKDLELIATLAREVRAPMPQLAVNHHSIEAAVDEGRGDEDVSALAERLRDLVRNSCEN